jgi:hypothetical protein
LAGLGACAGGLSETKAKLANSFSQRRLRKRLTETDAEIVPLIEKIATSTGEIEKLIGGMQEAKNWRDLARQHQNLGNPPPQSN